MIQFTSISVDILHIKFSFVKKKQTDIDDILKWKIVFVKFGNLTNDVQCTHAVIVNWFARFLWMNKVKFRYQFHISQSLNVYWKQEIAAKLWRMIVSSFHNDQNCIIPVNGVYKCYRNCFFFARSRCVNFGLKF